MILALMFPAVFVTALAVRAQCPEPRKRSERIGWRIALTGCPPLRPPAPADELAAHLLPPAARRRQRVVGHNGFGIVPLMIAWGATGVGVRGTSADEALEVRPVELPYARGV